MSLTSFLRGGARPNPRPDVPPWAERFGGREGAVAAWLAGADAEGGAAGATLARDLADAALADRWLAAAGEAGWIGPAGPPTPGAAGEPPRPSSFPWGPGPEWPAARAWAAARRDPDAARRDPDGRRRSFARAVEGYDWPVVHREHADHLGPLSIEHAPGTATIRLGRAALRTVREPTGAELFEAVRAERRRLDEAARLLWPRLREAAVALQGAQGTAAWTDLVLAVAGGGGGGKAQQVALTYALVLAREGLLAPGWRVSFAPPSLAQQSRAVDVPRATRPGSPERAFALRLEGPL